MKISAAYRINTLRMNITDGPKAKDNSNRTFTVHHVEIVERDGMVEVTIGGQENNKLVYLTKIYHNSDVAEGEMPEWLTDLVGEELAKL